MREVSAQQRALFAQHQASFRPYELLGRSALRQILLRLQATAGPEAFAGGMPPALTELERAEVSRLEARIGQFQARLEAQELPRERAE